MKNIKYYILLFILCLVPSFVNASDYKVKDYSITIDIDNNRNYKYSENINLIFEKSDVSVSHPELKENVLAIIEQSLNKDK